MVIDVTFYRAVPTDGGLFPKEMASQKKGLAYAYFIDFTEC